MVKIKFNEIEKKLLEREFRWYYGQYFDDDMFNISKKDDLTEDDIVKIKDMMREYHKKTGLGNKYWHDIEKGIFAKFNEAFKKKILSTDQKATLERKKLEEKKRKEAEKAEKKAKKEKEKAEKKAKKEADKKAEELRKKQEELNKDKYSISDVFHNITPDK